MDGMMNQQSALTKALVTFSAEPERQPEEWRIFKQLLLGTLPDDGVADVMTGDRQPPAFPREDVTAQKMADHQRQV